MKIDVITCLPELFEGWTTQSILKKAQEKGHVSINIHNVRDYALDKHRRTDDYAFGFNAGMVMMIEPMARLIRKLQETCVYEEVIYLTPDGERLNQKTVNSISLNQNIILICGHYKGIDQRIRDMFVTKEISIGDYVLTGGELAAAVLIDAIVRLVPGVISDETSALTDSFQDNLLAPPVYTRPADFEGHIVPPILLSGHEKNIRDWQDEQALAKTKERRPDLLD